ncbi:MAG TPA: PIG-L family deacetylase [Steroidobacteraceae bacterium]|nr:PIG-L family deacetylase [Steroidobacteraceae bacterium]
MSSDRRFGNRHAMYVSLALVGLLARASGAAQSAPPETPPAINPHNVSVSYDPYRFAPGASVAQQLRLTGTPEGVRFTWPKVSASQWDTALLAVQSWGAESQPWVEVSAGAATTRQYLDPNAIGIRWLNVSGLRAQLVAGAEVTLRAHAVTLGGEDATLRLFQNQLDLGQRLLIVAPHPDDAEIAAFGLYAGRQSTVVTVTAGNAGAMNYRAQVADPPEHYRLKGYLRAVDSVVVPWQGGIPPERAYNLGYFDGRLDAMYAAPALTVPEVYGPNTDVAPYRRANLSSLLPNGSRTNTWNHLVEDLVVVLRKVNPATIVMPDPRLDSHLDHEYTTVAVVQALEQWNRDATFLLYTNHAGGNRYPYGPAGSVTSLPPLEPAAADILLQKVFSYETDPRLQIRKLFALESMHDLRLSPEEQSTCDAPNVQHRTDDYPRTYEEDYLRRAVRANEIFYAFDRAGVRELVRGFLESGARTRAAQ